MKKGRFKIYFCTFSIIFALVFFAVGFYSVKDGWSSKSSSETIISKTSSQNNSVSSESQKYDCKSTFDFYVNPNRVSKTKTICGKTTVFSVEFDLFVTNTSSHEAALNLDAITASYDLGNSGSFYSLDYDKSDNMLLVQSQETGSVNFVLKYIVTDTENFEEYENNNLTACYMQTEIISEQV